MQLRFFLAGLPLVLFSPQLRAQAGTGSSNPYSTFTLISGGAAIQPGQPTTVGVRIALDAGWHTYWTNGGDAGLPMSVSWKLPRGVTAGPLQFPTPRLLPQGPLMSYGYEDQLIALVEITADAAAVRSGPIVLSAAADWLTCSNMCLPSSATASVAIPVRAGQTVQAGKNSTINAALLQQMRDALPRRPDLRATLWVDDSTLLLAVVDTATRALRDRALRDRTPYVFPDSSGIIDHALVQRVAYAGDTLWVSMSRFLYETPDAPRFSGLLSANPNRQDATTWHFTATVVREGNGGRAGNSATLRRRGELLVASAAATVAGGIAAAQLARSESGSPASSGADGFVVRMRDADAGTFQPGAFAGALPQGTLMQGAVPQGASPQRALTEGASPQSEAGSVGRNVNTTTNESAPANSSISLLSAMLFALVGGLLLNLMPCVFPVLSVKVLSFVERGANDPSVARKHALVFAAGVLATFWVLAIALLVVRAGGASVGWGFQLQSPVVVALLALILFALGLNLAGVFDIGMSATRLGGIGSGRGYRDSFLTGALAVVVATPCTAPFMGVALGFALVQPPAAGLAVFTTLALGLALPYVLLAWSPSLLRRLPRSGPWLETFKQALAFPMFATVSWLVWVFGQQTDMNAVAGLLFALTALALGAWLLGRSRGSVARVMAVVVLVFAVGLAAVTARSETSGSAMPDSATPGTAMSGSATIGDAERQTGTNAAPNTTARIQWLEFSPARLDSARATGQPVLVDFTAAWCLSCQVNERVALRSASVQREVASQNVIALRADWTARDADIANIIESYGRSGIPLYVLYSVNPAHPPELLPTVLTPRGVVDAIRRAAGARSGL